METRKREQEKIVGVKFKYFSRVGYDFSFPIDNNPKVLFKFCVLAHRPTMMYIAPYSTGGLLHGTES